MYEARLINVEEALRQKAPEASKKIPRFVVRFLAWLICQKEMNETITALKDCEGVDFAKGMCQRLHVTYTVDGMDNIPDTGRFIFASNHPLGAFDGISYINLLGQHFPKFKVIVNDLLMYIVGLQPVFLPVNTMGRQRSEDMQAVKEALQDDETQVMTFPAGFCSRFMEGKIQDVAWKKSVITQAVEHQRDIIPMHFEGRNSLVFYGIEWLRRVCGMKFNIGLLLLPWQMMRTARGKHFTITIGRPIPWQTFADKQRTPTEWAAWLRQQCYALPQ